MHRILILPTAHILSSSTQHIGTHHDPIMITKHGFIVHQAANSQAQRYNPPKPRAHSHQ